MPTKGLSHMNYIDIGCVDPFLLLRIINFFLLSFAQAVPDSSLTFLPCSLILPYSLSGSTMGTTQ